MQSDLKLKKFLHIIRDSPVYPVIMDADRNVLSLPPIINGNKSKMTFDTRNIFIECTATDLNKAKIVLATLVAMMSEHCENQFTYEPVDVVYPDGQKQWGGGVRHSRSHRCSTFPDMEHRKVTANIDYIRTIVGVELATDTVLALLNKLQLAWCARRRGTALTPGSTLSSDGVTVEADVPPTRSGVAGGSLWRALTRPDVLQACDIAEDVAIAYGYNNVPLRVPQTVSVGSQQPINALTDLLRLECATAGFTEALTWGLVSPPVWCVSLTPSVLALGGVRVPEPQRRW